LVLIPFAGADWIMFRSDPSHSGAVTDNPALTATLLWKYTTFDDGAGHVYSSPAIANGVLYVSSCDFNIINRQVVVDTGGVFALNAASGSKLWNYTIGDVRESSPAVVNGVVYIGSTSGNVYALNAASGTLIWNNNVGGYIYSSPTVVSGVVYVGS
jgi:outer membrane protein assembly factor BamB